MLSSSSSSSYCGCGRGGAAGAAGGTRVEDEADRPPRTPARAAAGFGATGLLGSDGTSRGGEEDLERRSGSSVGARGWMAEQAVVVPPPPPRLADHWLHHPPSLCSWRGRSRNRHRGQPESNPGPTYRRLEAVHHRGRITPRRFASCTRRGLSHDRQVVPTRDLILAKKKKKKKKKTRTEQPRETMQNKKGEEANRRSPQSQDAVLTSST